MADLGVPALIGPRFVGRVPIHASHIPERFALFTIIVLGESVVAVALSIAVAFATLMLAVLVALVTFEVSRNLRSDAHPSPKPSASAE